MSGMKGTKDGQTPAKEGYGQSAGEGSTENYTRTEQDGENRLLTEGEFNDRSRMMGNE